MQDYEAGEDWKGGQSRGSVSMNEKVMPDKIGASYAELEAL